MTDRDDRRGHKIAGMKIRMPVNFEDHSGTLTGYIPIDDEHDPRLVLRSNWDGGVPETVMSEVDLITAIALLENVPDDGMPDRTPAGTFELLHSWAMQWFHNRSKQKS